MLAKLMASVWYGLMSKQSIEPDCDWHMDVCACATAVRLCMCLQFVHFATKDATKKKKQNKINKNHISNILVERVDIDS